MNHVGVGKPLTLPPYNLDLTKADLSGFPIINQVQQANWKGRFIDAKNANTHPLYWHRGSINAYHAVDLNNVILSLDGPPDAYADGEFLLYWREPSAPYGKNGFIVRQPRAIVYSSLGFVGATQGEDWVYKAMFDSNANIWDKYGISIFQTRFSDYLAGHMLYNARTTVPSATGRYDIPVGYADPNMDGGEVLEILYGRPPGASDYYYSLLPQETKLVEEAYFQHYKQQHSIRVQQFNKYKRIVVWYDQTNDSLFSSEWSFIKQTQSMHMAQMEQYGWEWIQGGTFNSSTTNDPAFVNTINGVILTRIKQFFGIAS